MEDGTRITVRIPSDDLVLLTELVSLGKYSSEADALSDALRLFLENNFSPADRESVLKKAKSLSSHDLNEFISEGGDAHKVLGNVMARGLDETGRSQ